MSNFNLKQIDLKTSDTLITSEVNLEYNELGIDDWILNLSITNFTYGIFSVKGLVFIQKKRDNLTWH